MRPSTRASGASISTSTPLQAALDIRRAVRLKLPHALILAGARARGLTLVTRNTKDFPPELPGVRLPYQLGLPAA